VCSADAAQGEQAVLRRVRAALPAVPLARVFGAEHLIRLIGTALPLCRDVVYL
jgi:hypothetical protein